MWVAGCAVQGVGCRVQGVGCSNAGLANLAGRHLDADPVAAPAAPPLPPTAGYRTLHLALAVLENVHSLHGLALPEELQARVDL